MVDHPVDPTLTDPPPARLSTAYAIGLGLAIVVHALLLAWMLNRIVLATNVTEPSVKDLAFVVPGSKRTRVATQAIPEAGTGTTTKPTEHSSQPNPRKTS